MRNGVSQLFRRLTLLGCSVISLLGCSQGDRPPLGTVTGTVTIDGEPLVGAIVTCQPEVGRAAAGLTDSQGRYELAYLDNAKGAKIGPSKVSLSWPIGFVGSHVIPDRYSVKTELTCDVQRGRNTFNFQLESDPDAKRPAPSDD